MVSVEKPDQSLCFRLGERPGAGAEPDPGAVRRPMVREVTVEVDPGGIGPGVGAVAIGVHSGDEHNRAACKLAWMSEKVVAEALDERRRDEFVAVHATQYEGGIGAGAQNKCRELPVLCRIPKDKGLHSRRRRGSRRCGGREGEEGNGGKEACKALRRMREYAGELHGSGSSYTRFPEAIFSRAMKIEHQEQKPSRYDLTLNCPAHDAKTG